jgi:hypothetical protein
MVKGGLAARLIEERRHRVQPELQCQVRHGMAMYVDRRRETAPILASLQQRRQRQAARIAAGMGADEIVVSVAHAVTGIQFLTGQSLTRTWVSRAVYCCHEVSGKGVAEDVAGSE